ncbi:MAG TPA: transglutaminase-like domain-containing protein, partial [Polyangiaceae bacterium]
MRLRSPLALAPIALAVMLPLVAAVPPALSAPASPAFRRTDVTPDAMIDDALSRATATGTTERAQAASMIVILDLGERAANGHAEEALARIATSPAATVDVRDQAALMARMAGATEGTESGARASHALGVVQALSILGPFRDTGGGLEAHDGPEGDGFATSGRYAWGSYDVAWREVPRAFAQATGVPLDVFVFPRKESCTWLASAIDVPRAQPLVLRAASTGQIRLAFDGTDVARDDGVNGSLRLDRLAVRVEATAGHHLLAAKVCTGALDDDGQVRLRITDEAGRWPDGVTEAPWSGALHGAKRPATRAATTLLGRSVGKPEGDAEARLDAAIVRTLGGADDLRSPRAPGMLATLAEGELSPDGFATAGWIAPIGSNRSAWLLRARADGDAATRAFAERRLVDRHAQAGMVDWAMATLRGAKLDEAKDAEAALMTATVEAALGTDALRVRALHRLESAARAEGDRAPDALLAALARTAEGIAPAVALATREQLAKRGEWGGNRVRVLASEKGRAAAVPAAQRAFAGGVSDAADALAVAQAVAKTGAHEDARLLFETLTRWAPNRAPVWAGLAQELSAAPADATGSAVIAASLRRARELEPAEARYRAELELRSKPSSREAETHEDERYIVPSETILARRVGVTRSPGTEAPDVSERDLYWLRAVVMHADRRVSEMVQYAHEVVIAPRTEDELYEDIRAEGDQTEILRARVHRRDGTEAFPVEEANEHASPRIRWPELSPGDVCEVAFRSWTAGPVGGRGDPPFYRLDYAGALTTHPLLYNEDVIESPADHPIFAGVVNGKADRTEERDENGRHVVRYVWDHPPAVQDEPLSPPISEIVPVLVMSTFKDWNAFRAWYADAVHGFTEPDAQVRAIAARLTKGKTTRDEKLRALFDFVADDIRYVNYVSGEWWLPNRPQQLLARREGDCDDKAILLITLLKSVGIEAQEVMVQTRLTNEPSIVRAKDAAIPLFDHG